MSGTEFNSDARPNVRSEYGMETKRVFAAIEIPDGVRDVAAQRIEVLRDEFGNRAARWVKPENLHITLRFFGDLTERMIEDVRMAIAFSAKRSASFSASMTGPGLFPSRMPAKVLWMGLEPEESFRPVKGALDNELAELGFAHEKRHFHPHLTLARVRSPGTARSLAEMHVGTEFEPVNFSVDRITVFQSVLKPSGSEYFKLFEERLAGVSG